MKKIINQLSFKRNDSIYLILDSISRAVFGFLIIISISYYLGFESLSIYGSALVLGGLIWLVGSMQYEKAVLAKEYLTTNDFYISIILRLLAYLILLACIYLLFKNINEYLVYSIIICLGLPWQFLDGFLKSRGVFSAPALFKLGVRSLFIIIKIIFILNDKLEDLFIVMAIEGFVIFLILSPIVIAKVKDENKPLNDDSSDQVTLGNKDIFVALLGWLNYCNNNFYILFGAFFLENTALGIFYFYIRLVDLAALLANPVQVKMSYQLRSGEVSPLSTRRLNENLLYIWLMSVALLFGGFLWRLFNSDTGEDEFFGVILMVGAALPFVLASMRVPFLVINRAVVSAIGQGLITITVSIYFLVFIAADLELNNQFLVLALGLFTTRWMTCFFSPLLFKSGRKFLRWQYSYAYGGHDENVNFR